MIFSPSKRAHRQRTELISTTISPHTNAVVNEHILNAYWKSDKMWLCEYETDLYCLVEYIDGISLNSFDLVENYDHQSFDIQNLCQKDGIDMERINGICVLDKKNVVISTSKSMIWLDLKHQKPMIEQRSLKYYPVQLNFSIQVAGGRIVEMYTYKKSDAY